MSDIFSGVKTKDVWQGIRASGTSARDAFKDPFSTESIKTAATTGAHDVTQKVSEKRKARAIGKQAGIEAEEQRLVDKEKSESAAAALKEKRGLRKRAAGRKGRRASIVTGPLGASGEPEIRRATLG